jgi:hypothetical protein
MRGGHGVKNAFAHPTSGVPSEALRDVDVLTAVTSGNRYDLRGTTRHIGPFGRGDIGGKPMGPIPGNVISRRVMNIARGRRCAICQRCDIRLPVTVGVRRPEIPCIPSPQMPQRVGKRRMGNRMRRRESARRRSGPGEALIQGKYKRDYAERRDKKRILF